MSVLCCHVPHFLYALAGQQHALAEGESVALLGPDETLWALSPAARIAGLTVGMTPQRARSRSPQVRLLPLNLPAAQHAQQHFLQILGEWALPVEAVQWGAGYVDLRTVTTDKEEVAQLAADVGRRLRRELGDTLQPALGWDSGKFTARAAALQTKPGRMRLVAAVDESRFLAPLPITFLPLPPATLQQLDWLGIKTLGAFGALPTAAVWQRFGQAGKLAQQWARGQDQRPVHPLTTASTMTLEHYWDPPTTQTTMIMSQIEKQLTATLARLQEQLQGCERADGVLRFADGSSRTFHLRPLHPTDDLRKLCQQLEHQLTLLNWPAPLCTLDLHLAVAELPMGQLSLLAESTATTDDLTTLATQLHHRHGPIFFRSAINEASHPVAERRAVVTALV